LGKERNTNTSPQTNLYFESKAKNIPADTFRLLSFEGHGKSSQPFRFTIELASERPDSDLDDILR